MKKYDYDIIVIGAGVAGGVFAASQKGDKKILVIERDLSEPDRIIGELMQPGGLKALKELGLSHLTDGIGAQQVHGYRLIKNKESFTISYNEIEDGIFGLGLKNGKFLTSIREDLKKRSNISLIQGAVIELVEEDGAIAGVKYKDQNGQLIEQRAHLTVVSDGPMSIFRKKLSNPNKQVSSYFMGLVLKDLDIEHPSLGHMIVSGDAPILVYPIYENSWRILIDYPGDKPPRMGSKSILKLREEIAKDLPEDMVQSFYNAIDNDQMQVMPNHSMKAQAFRKNGAVLLGDSLNMRHPITGGGMTASFTDIISLNEKLKDVDLSDQQATWSAVEDYYESRTEKVETINILANALYKVFRDEDLKDAVFEYLQRGGEKSTGPLSLLAGINRNKKYLLKHFFNVALQHPLHFITRPKKQLRLYRSAVRVIKPILKEEDKPAIV